MLMSLSLSLSSSLSSSGLVLILSIVLVLSFVLVVSWSWSCLGLVHVCISCWYSSFFHSLSALPQNTDSICLSHFHVLRVRMHKFDMDAATKTIRELHFFMILIYCILCNISLYSLLTCWHQLPLSPSPYNYHVGIQHQMTARNQKGRRTHSCALHFLWIIASRLYVRWSLSIRCPSWLAGNGCLWSARYRWYYYQIPSSSGAHKLAVSMSVIAGRVMPLIVVFLRWAQVLSVLEGILIDRANCAWFIAVMVLFLILS